MLLVYRGGTTQHRPSNPSALSNMSHLIVDTCEPTKTLITFLTPPGSISSPVVTPNLYKPLPSPHGPVTPSSSHPSSSADLPSPSMGALVGGVPPLNQAGLALESPQEGHLPASGAHQGNCLAQCRVPSSKAEDSHQRLLVIQLL